ncbi:hypothetical protein P3T73_03545 [Kiritimatiellota bacterium B12222]|nr:hypothetical protein P3T73_03545 [Kiritimatiellota bacterium B12222]
MKILSKTFLGLDGFTTYPHMNGYVDGGRALVYMRTFADTRNLFLRDLESGEEKELAAFDKELEGSCWDIALNTRRLAMVLSNQAWIMDLDHPEDMKVIYTPDDTCKLDTLCSLTPDGRRLLCGEVRGALNVAIEIDVETGEVRDLFSKRWHANHFHYCPHDDRWVAFSHEGKTEEIPDRCWVWHAEHAPEGKCAFDQASDTPGVLLCVGHERWGFHDVSGYAPAYAHSPAGNRGLYEIFADGRPAKLVWKSDVIWHCSMDLTGRYVAVDTAGPIRDEPYTEKEYAEHLAYFKKHDQAKIPIFGDVAILDLETQDFVYVASARWSKHPFHPHPAISPDARWVAWNDFNPEKKGIWLAEIEYS